MDQFLAWISRIIDAWKFWIVVAPWEVGVRVRLGRSAAKLTPGFHFRVPFIDSVTLINTRLRIDGTPPVTVSGSHPTRTRYISATVGYLVSDPLKAMLRFGFPSAVVISKAQGEIAASRGEKTVLDALQLFFDADSGIAIQFIKFVEDVEVKTFRLINGGSWVSSGHESYGPGGAPAMRY